MRSTLRLRYLAPLATIVASVSHSAVAAPPRTGRAPRATAGRTSAVIPAEGTRSRSQTVDIALDPDHALRGRFVDSGGAPIDGAVVVLTRAERVVAQTTTLADGTFAIAGVETGAYRLACGSSAGPIRCWTSDAAPPNAVADGVTFQDNAIRGQAMLVAPALFGNSIATTATVAGSAIGGVAVYSAAEGGSSSKNTTKAGGEPVPEPASGGRPPSLMNGDIVGRDSSGQLIRIRGTAPWEAAANENGPRPPSDASGIALPENWPRPIDDTYLPASP